MTGFFTPGNCGCCTCRCAETDDIYFNRFDAMYKIVIAGVPDTVDITQKRNPLQANGFDVFQYANLSTFNGTHFFQLPKTRGGCIRPFDPFGTTSGTITLGTVTKTGTAFLVDNYTACTPTGTLAISQSETARLNIDFGLDSFGVTMGFTGGFGRTSDFWLSGCQSNNCKDAWDGAAESSVNNGIPDETLPCSEQKVWARIGHRLTPNTECGYTETDRILIEFGTIEASIV